MIERIVALAKSKGLKMSYLEQQLGLYRGKVADWKLNRSSPSEVELRKIAKLLGTTEAYLRGETNDPQSGDQHDLDGLEWAMIEGFRDLTDDDKREMLAILELKKSKRKK